MSEQAANLVSGDTIARFKQANPSYAEVPDATLADALYKKYYSGVMSRDDFNTRLTGYPTPAPNMAPGGSHDAANAIAGADIASAVKLSPGEKIGYGAANILQGAGQLGAHAIGAVTGDTSFPEAVDRTLNRDEQNYQNRRAQSGESGFDGWRFVGNAIGAVPMAATLPAATGPLVGAASGGLAGAASAATAPVYDSDKFWGDKLNQLQYGTAGGMATGGAGGLASRVIYPQVPEAARTLRDQGVSLTVGQTLGGGRDASLFGKTIRGLESKAESIPGFGDAIKNRKMLGLESYNRSVIDMPLKEIGAELPSDIPTGRPSVSYMQQKVKDAYDAALPNMTAFADQQFATDLQAAAANLRIAPSVQNQFVQIMKDKLAAKFDPATQSVSGDDFKLVDSEIRRLASNYLASADGDQRELGRALANVHKAFLDAGRRASPPEAVDALNKADRAYAMMVRIEDASTRAGTAARDGMFTPAQLDAAVRGNDPSLRGRAYARGAALMQDTAAAGVKTLGETVPNSGTADRLATQNISQWLLGLPLGATAYSGPAQRGANALIAGGAGVRQPVAGILQNSLPAIAGPAGGPAGQALFGQYGILPLPLLPGSPPP